MKLTIEVVLPLVAAFAVVSNFDRSTPNSYHRKEIIISTMQDMRLRKFRPGCYLFTSGVCMWTTVAWQLLKQAKVDLLSAYGMIKRKGQK